MSTTPVARTPVVPSVPLNGPPRRRTPRQALVAACVTLFPPASGICAPSGSVAVFGPGRTLAVVGLGGRAALTVGALMAAHHAGGIVSAHVAKWLAGPHDRRSAFRVRVLPLLFVPVLAKARPESLSFLVAKGRTDEAAPRQELAAG